MTISSCLLISLKRTWSEYLDTSDWTRNCTIPEAVLTSGLAAIAGRDTSGCRGLYSDLAPARGAAEGSRRVGQHSRCERYARACFGDPSGRSTWIGCTMSI